MTNDFKDPPVYRHHQVHLLPPAVVVTVLLIVEPVSPTSSEWKLISSLQCKKWPDGQRTWTQPLGGALMFEHWIHIDKCRHLLVSCCKRRRSVAFSLFMYLSIWSVWITKFNTSHTKKSVSLKSETALIISGWLDRHRVKLPRVSVLY